MVQRKIKFLILKSTRLSVDPKKKTDFTHERQRTDEVNLDGLICANL
jgi:hypothetical protein